jgi:2-polyprenyl-3-methyl-5-hydroxy-6-metoxy-1,4-benzoquinol methylase
MRWKFWKSKIDRNQWSEDKEDALKTYHNMMRWTWDETRLNAPKYFARLKYSVGKARGRVLEIGAGIGTMTRWLAESDAVESILATDAFESPIEELRQTELSKTTPKCMKVEAMELNPNDVFDTVMICEVLEHIYLDEEKKMLKGLRDHLAPDARFVISTPIGLMPDPHHVRGFNKKQFRKHLEKHYGPIRDVNYESGYSQVAWGCFK